MPLNLPIGRPRLGTDSCLSSHRVCVIVRICTFPGEIYEHTKKLDTQPAALFTRRSRYIPIWSKNVLEFSQPPRKSAITRSQAGLNLFVIRQDRQKLFRNQSNALSPCFPDRPCPGIAPCRRTATPVRQMDRAASS